ncbi:MAG TPA: dihydrofolate reductase family protein [Candidatus Saccharimonadales bacterium]|nr:dihydrofolate reductase family protein [Candidatus Saccharimonadales bacterium]
MMKKNSSRPYATLFLLQSLDGKISTGDVDDRDFDKDLPNIPGVKKGLHQYYEIEQTTDNFSFITGRVMAKVGVNTNSLEDIPQIPITFVVVDNKPHLTAHGVEFLARKFGKLLIVTTDKAHPAYSLQEQYPNIAVLHYSEAVDFTDLFTKLHTEHGSERMTIQSGGELNAVLLRAGLIDRVLLVVAPCLIGGRSTATLVDGDPLQTTEDLAKIRPLKLKKCKALEDSYALLEYEVVDQ